MKKNHFFAGSGARPLFRQVILSVMMLLLYAVFFTSKSAAQVTIDFTGKSNTDIYNQSGGFILTYGMLKKRFNEVTLPGTHNAYSTGNHDTNEEGYINEFPFYNCTEQNQGLKMKDQALHGIRYFDLDFSHWYGDWVARHGASTGYLWMDHVVEVMKEIVQANPNTVWAIEVADIRVAETASDDETFWCYGCDEDQQKRAVLHALLKEIKSQGLSDKVYNWDMFNLINDNTFSVLPASSWLYYPAQAGQWPTLEQMISTGKNLMIIGTEDHFFQTRKSILHTYSNGAAQTFGGIYPTDGIEQGAIGVDPLSFIKAETYGVGTGALTQLEWGPSSTNCTAGDKDRSRQNNGGERIYQLARRVENKLNSIDVPALFTINVDYHRGKDEVDYNLVDACNRLNYERLGYNYRAVSGYMAVFPEFKKYDPVVVTGTNINSTTAGQTGITVTFTVNAAADGDLFSPANAQNNATITYDFGTSSGRSINMVAVAWEAFSRSFSVSVSNDNVNWTPVTATMATGATIRTWWKYTLGRAVTERYIRFSVGAGNVYEISCFDNTAVGQLDCIAPSNLNTTGIASNVATLNWTGTGSNAVNYRVEYKLRTASAWNLASANVAGTSFILSGLFSNTTYDWRVLTNCDQGVSITPVSLYSTGSFTTTGPCAAPANLASSSISVNSAVVSWSPASNAQSYSVRYRRAAIGENFIIISPVVATSFTLTNLASSASYEWGVATNCIGGTSSPYSISTLVTSTPPPVCAGALPPPSFSLQANQVTSASARLQWNAVQNVSIYFVDYRRQGTTSWINAGTTATIFFDLAGLSPATAYEWRVAGGCTGSSTGYTTGNFVTTNVCAPPVAISFSTTATSASISWENIPGAINYALEYRSGGSTTWNVFSNTLISPSATITGLSSQTLYYSRIRILCNSGWGPYTPDKQFWTGLSCDSPTGLVSFNITTSSASVGWATGPIIFNHIVEYKQALSATWINAGGGPSGTSLSGLLPGTAYDWRVRQVCSGGSSPFAQSQFTTLGSAATCAAPSGLASSAISSTGATVSWAAVSGGVSYQVHYKLASSTGWISAISSTTATSASITGLMAATTYDWRVLTICSGSSISIYTVAQFTTSAATTPCTAPTGLSSSAISSSGATLNWTAVSGATNYTVEYKTTAASTWTTAAANTTATSANILGLSASTAYDWRVRTNCASGSSGYTQAQFTTSAATSSCVTAYESSETQATAAAISTNTAVSAAIGSSTDVDYYSFTVSGTSNFNIMLTNVPAAQDYDLFLYNASGLELLKSELGTGASETITRSNQPAGTYYVRVIGYNGSFNATQCYTLNAGVTAVGATCNAPSLLAPSASSSLATISWAAVSGAVSYDVDYKLSSSSTWTSAATATANLSVNITGLTASSTYDYRVRTNCPSGSSGYNTSQFLTGSASCNPSSSLNSSGVGNTSATVGWSAVGGALNYEVHYKPVTVTNWGLAAVVTVPTNSANLNGLTGSTVYDWRVRTLCAGGGSSAYVVSQFSTSATSCTAPSNLTATGINSSGATLGWAAVSGAVNYDVDYKLSSSANWVSAASGTVNNTINLGSLSASSGFDWRVRTNCLSGSSGYVQAQFTTTSSPSGCVNAYEPNELQGTAASMAINTPISAGIGSNVDVDYYSFAVTGTSNISITLTNVPATQDYDLYLYNGSGTELGNSSGGTGASETIALSNLAPGTYYIRVTGYNGAFNTTLCYTLNAGVTPVGGAACTAPTGLSASAVTSSSATVSWSATSGALNYTVEYKPTSSANWITAQSSTTSTSANLSGLSISTLYDWRVRTNCIGGSSTYGQAQFGTLGASACAAPGGLTVASISNTGASLSWTPVSGAVSYNLDYKMAASSNWVSNFVNITNTTVPLVGLSASTLYDWRVRSNCSEGNSVFSQSQLTTTAAAVSCAAPGGLTASAISSSGATVNWTAVSNFWYYTIEYKRTTDANWIFANYSVSGSLTLTGLTAATTYDWRISTTCLNSSTSAVSQSQFSTSGAGGAQSRAASPASIVTVKKEDKVAVKVGVALYPNPVSDQLTIVSSGPMRMVKLISVSGQTVGTHPGMGRQVLQVHVGRLRQGVYMVQVTTSDGTTSLHKMVKK